MAGPDASASSDTVTKAALCALVLVRTIPKDIHVPAGSVSTILSALGNLRLMVAVTFTATPRTTHDTRLTN